MYLGQSLMIVGAYMGVCIDVLYLGGTPQNINRTNSRIKALGRVAIAMLSTYIMLAISNLPMFRDFQNPHGAIKESLFSFMLPSLLFPAFMFSGLKYIFAKLKLDRSSLKDDTLKSAFV